MRGEGGTVLSSVGDAMSEGVEGVEGVVAIPGGTDVLQDCIPKRLSRVYIYILQSSRRCRPRNALVPPTQDGMTFMCEWSLTRMNFCGKQYRTTVV